MEKEPDEKKEMHQGEYNGELVLIRENCYQHLSPVKISRSLQEFKVLASVYWDRTVFPFTQIVDGEMPRIVIFGYSTGMPYLSGNHTAYRATEPLAAIFRDMRFIKERNLLLAREKIPRIEVLTMVGEKDYAKLKRAWEKNPEFGILENISREHEDNILDWEIAKAIAKNWNMKI